MSEEIEMCELIKKECEWGMYACHKYHPPEPCPHRKHDPADISECDCKYKRCVTPEPTAEELKAELRWCYERLIMYHPIRDTGGGTCEVCERLLKIKDVLEGEG